MFIDINFAAFDDDDEDDIMIVEEKDELDVSGQIEYVAEEVIIEETAADELYVLCDSPNNFSQNSISDSECKMESEDHEDAVGMVNEASDNNDSQSEQIADIVNTECDNPTEPIYLSDSLSCFDSDSDTQESDMPKSIGHSLETNDASKQQDSDDDDEVEAMNESTDDVIIMPECTDTIEIDRSDSDDERFASKFSFEPFVESDSQALVESVEAVELVDLDKCENSGSIENGFKAEYMNKHLDETTTDADDDSSEVEKRTTRSRRDNTARKNYSYRRTYAKRKSKNDSETQQTSESNVQREPVPEPDGSSNDVEQIERINTEEHLDIQANQSKNILKLTVQDNSNTTDGTDEECLSNSIRTKVTRTHLRRSALLPKTVSFASDTNLLDSPNFNDLKKSESDSHSENTAGSSNDVELSSDSKPVEHIPPRKRGRPRKKFFFPNPAKPNSDTKEKVDAKTDQQMDNQPLPDANEANEQTEIHEPNVDAPCKTSTELHASYENSAECHEQSPTVPVVIETLHDSSVSTQTEADDTIANETIVVVEIADETVEDDAVVTLDDEHIMEFETIETIAANQSSESHPQSGNMDVDCHASESGKFSWKCGKYLFFYQFGKYF